MQGWKKWFVAVLLISVTLLATSIGMAQKGPAVKELTLQQAVYLAMQNNPEIELARIDVKSAQVSYDGAVDVAEDLDVDRVQTYDLGKLKWVAPAASKMALNMAIEQQKVKEKSIKLSVEQAYYNVLKTAQLLNVKKGTLKYAQDQLKIAQDSLKVGSMSKGDVTGVEALVAASQAGATSAQNDYDSAVMELNKLIGLPLDTPLKLTTSFDFVKATDIKPDQTLKEALANNIEIISVKENKELKKVEFTVAQKFLGGGVTSYENAKLAEQTADIKVKKQEQDTTLAVKKDYLTLLSLEQVINLNKKEVEKQQENLRIYLLKYKSGLVTGQDVKKATLDLESSKQKLAESIYTYNTLKSKFKYGLFTSSSTGM